MDWKHLCNSISQLRLSSSFDCSSVQWITMKSSLRQFTIAKGSNRSKTSGQRRFHDFFSHTHPLKTCQLSQKSKSRTFFIISLLRNAEASVRSKKLSYGNMIQDEEKNVGRSRKFNNIANRKPRKIIGIVNYNSQLLQ